MPVTRDYPASIALYANPDGFVGAILFAPSLDDRRPRMDHRAAKLIEIRCRKDASILYRLKPLFYLIWALLALTRTGHLSPIIRESQILLAPFPVIRPVDVCTYIRDGYDEIQRRKEKSRIEGFLAFLHESAGCAIDHGRKAVFVVIGGGLMGFGNQVSGQIGKTGNSISSWFGKANGAGDNASGGNGTGGGNNAGGENKGDENSGSQLQAPTVSVTGMDVVGERVTAKASNLPEGATRVSYQWQYSATKTGTFSDIKYGGNKNSYEISEEDEDYYLRCKVTTSSSKGKVPDAYSETIGKVYVFDWSKYPTGSYRPRFNGNSLACCAAPYDSSTQIPSLGEGDYASIVFDNELSNIPQGNITYRWFKCAGLGSGAGLVAKELGSSPSLSLSGLQGSYINCEVTLTVNGKSKTFVPKAICNGKVSDGIYVRPRIG